MQHATGMCVRDRIADVFEQLDPLRGREPVGVRPSVDGAAVHQGHREPRAPLFVEAGVEDRHDAGMIQPCQQVALGLEGVSHDVGGARFQDPLDRDLVGVLAVRTRGAEDHAHATRAQALVQLPRPDALAHAVGILHRVGRRLGDCVTDGIQGVAFPRVGAQQCDHGGVGGRIPATQSPQPPSPDQRMRIDKVVERVEGAVHRGHATTPAASGAV